MKPSTLACLFLSFLFILACQPKKGLADTKATTNYFPSVLGDLLFNLPLDEVLKRRPDLAPVNYVNDAFVFRKEFVEELKFEGLCKVIYYFDTDNFKPLYEVILVFDDEKSRDVQAQNLLGKPNAESNSEWLFDSGSGYKIKAWKFEKKLVLAALLSGTEWEP